MAFTVILKGFKEVSKQIYNSFGQFGSLVLTTLRHSFLCTCSVAEHEKLKTPYFRANTTWQQLKHQCIINIILTLNPKYNTIPAAKKIYSIPAEMRTSVLLSLAQFRKYFFLLIKKFKNVLLLFFIIIILPFYLIYFFRKSSFENSKHK